jgi:metal-responsive CopG/Arc/MetJ family transcriptional regulator
MKNKEDKRGRVIVAVSLPATDYDKLEAYKNETLISRSRIIQEAVRQYIDKGSIK